MNKGMLGQAVAMFLSGAILCSTLAFAQEQKGDWPLTGSDAGQTGWQKDEYGLTQDNIPANFKFLWKIKLGQSTSSKRSFSEPLLAGRLINAQGFKDIVYWSSADTLFAVDSELGSLIWKHEFKTATPGAGCGLSSLGLLTEPPVIINFKARRKRARGTPEPPEPDPVAAATNARRLGVPPGGGYFGLKGIYVLTPDGMLHEQVMTTGADFAPPVKFLPAANAAAYGLNFNEKTIVTATGRDCGSVPDGLWAIDLTSASYTVANYATRKVRPLGITGPVITPAGKSLAVTGPGTSDSTAGVYANSVVSLSKELKVEDWYSPDGGMANYGSVSPVAFTSKERQFIVAPARDGRIALLDAASLGGADHHTPLFETPPITKAGEKHGWDGFASWQDKAGTTWVFASISAALALDDDNVTKASSSNLHGGIVAFKLEDTGGKYALRPVWVSPDMINPAPPRIANGVLVALSGGDSTTHAILYVLSAETGAKLYSSENQIPTYTEFSGVAIADSHAFFTDHDNVLYSFGIALEH